MLRSFTTTTSSQVIREKVRGVQNFKILVGTTGRRAAVRRYAACGPPVCRPRTAEPPPFAARAPPLPAVFAAPPA